MDSEGGMEGVRDIAADLNVLLKKIRQEINASQDEKSLEEVRVRYLGRRSQLHAESKRIGCLPVAQRPVLGAHLNKVRSELRALLATRSAELVAARLDAEIHSEHIDVTLQGRGRRLGSSHPISRVLERIVQIFRGAGYDVEEGPEIEDDYHNFTALNIPPRHPARDMHDTFHVAGRPDKVLRTHTSPVQVRVMETRPPPVRIICPGKVYRVDNDPTHAPMFHQVEGLLIDEQVSFADLKGTVLHFLRSFFETEDVIIRLRPSYFPFTEPSAETDMRCTGCQGAGCRMCSGTGWLEVMGCGMVHPEVFALSGVDSTKYSGFAFGFGVERLAMLRYGVRDLRTFFENDWRFLRQFA